MPLPSSSLKRRSDKIQATRAEGDVLDTKECVVLRDTLATRGSTGLDLANTESDNKVGDDGVLSLTTAVRDHDTPAIRLCELRTVKGLGISEDSQQTYTSGH